MCPEIDCPVCSGLCKALDVVDFNKSCEEARGSYLPLSGVAIYYFLCCTCGFCFAPDFSKWSLDDFEEKIYNDNYILIDPDYLSDRPRNNAGALLTMFGEQKDQIKHLDYGGGNGLLSKQLRDQGWDSTSYDPFVDRDINMNGLGGFDLITAFEVFEHVPDVKRLMSDLASLLNTDGIVLFSTLVSNDNIRSNQRITWWYASPRNGHISLFSKESLCHLATQRNWNFGSFSEGFHAFWKSVPSWAGHVFQA